MSWHLPCFLLAAVTLPSACLHFNPQPLEELGSDIGIQVFNQIVKSRPRDNIIVSPHGIASALGMLQLGASGRTKLQLAMMMKYNVNGACAGPRLQDRAGVVPGSCARRVRCWVSTYSPEEQAEQAAWGFTGAIWASGHSPLNDRCCGTRSYENWIPPASVL